MAASRYEFMLLYRKLSPGMAEQSEKKKARTQSRSISLPASLKFAPLVIVSRWRTVIAAMRGLRNSGGCFSGKKETALSSAESSPSSAASPTAIATTVFPNENVICGSCAVYGSRLTHATSFPWHSTAALCSFGGNDPSSAARKNSRR